MKSAIRNLRSAIAILALWPCALFAATPASQPAAIVSAPAVTTVTPATWAAAQAGIQPGDTIVFADNDLAGQGGPYRLRIRTAWSGTAEQPTIFRAAQRWRAVASTDDRWQEAAASFEMFAHDVVIDGFQIGPSWRVGLAASWCRNITLRNCWIHNCASQGLLMGGCQNLTLENCLIEFNGCNPQHMHGAYVSGDGLLVSGCIVRHNGNGLSLNPVIGATIVDSLIVDNDNGGIAMYPLSPSQRVTTVRRCTVANNRRVQMVIDASDRSSTPNLVIDECLLIGRAPIAYARVRPHDEIRPSTIQAASFGLWVAELVGDYRLVPASTLNVGWPRSRWPIDLQDWDTTDEAKSVHTVPYAPSVNVGAPRSLFPE